MTSAIEAYDALAPLYDDYAGAKAAYIAAVDRFVLEATPGRVESLLDVGAANGARGVRLARGMGAKRIVLAEPSPEMAARCREIAGVEVWPVGAESLPEDAGRFDVVTCLWNVLGHIPDHASRVSGLRRMRTLLGSGGRLFLDVNNRHNAAAYGWGRVLGRVALDALAPDERRGDVEFTWRIGEKAIPARGHLFTPREVRGLFAESGLEVARWTAIDYRTGARAGSALRGQLAFALSPRKEG
jgi:SAM-dependent methyltransferase